MARPAGYWPDIFEAQRFWTRQAPGKETGRIQLEAMNFFSNTQEIAWRFSEYIDDLHDVFRCNDVDFGAPEDFFAFARTLRYHSELRGDVLRVVPARQWSMQRFQPMPALRKAPSPSVQMIPRRIPPSILLSHLPSVKTCRVR